MSTPNTTEEKKPGNGKKIVIGVIIALVVMAIIGAIVGGNDDDTDTTADETTAAAEPTTVDTGIHGIQVPADVENEGRGDDIYTATLDWDYEETVEWMNDELPVGEPINGMAFGGDTGDDLGHDWCWSGEADGGQVEMVTVFASNAEPVELSVLRGSGEVGCTN